MPYSNVPKKLWPAMEKCVAAVKGKVDNPYAVCYSRVVGGGVAKAAKKRKGGK